MAVEARHLNLFPSQQLVCNNSEIMNPVHGNASLYGAPMGGYGGLMPLMTAGSAVAMEALIPAYTSTNNNNNSEIINNHDGIINSMMLLPKTAAAMQSDSDLTYNVAPLPRKRSRVDDDPNFFSYPTHFKNNTNTNTNNNCFSFIGEDFSHQIHQQQLDVDHLISQHMEKVRAEMEERRKRQATRVMESIEVGMMKRLIAKEVEIEKIAKINWALEEKVKSLCIENQIWRDLAQTNETTANALRTNLEQVLAQVRDDQPNNQGDSAALADDAQSCCGSTGGEVAAAEWRAVNNNNEGTSGSGTVSRSSSPNSGRWCRNCGKEESCVLLLPCRHLCLCTVCGSSLHTCPVCKSSKNASVHVNVSSF